MFSDRHLLHLKLGLLIDTMHGYNKSDFPTPEW